ncbi:MAG TPA: hypothetical protein VJJ78_02675 [Candidatus Saccharimonadales bacterium]|nr:hypothetical protein [Candidatus Saccharimonadales bacterium]
MVIIKVLKRKDASSVIVAVVLALVAISLVSAPAADLSNKIVNSGQGDVFANWEDIYLQPAVLALLQVAFLEVVGWIYLLVASTIAPRLAKR